MICNPRPVKRPAPRFARESCEPRQRQATRFVELPGVFTNATNVPKMVEEFCRIEEEGRRLLEEAMRRLQLSARAYERILKVARTIADLSDEEHIRPPHLAEAPWHTGP